MARMSWKRILRAARRMGAPVIVADEQGSDPLVIMPLEMFERSPVPQQRPTSTGIPGPEETVVEYRTETRRASGNKVSEPDERAASAFETLPIESEPERDLPVEGQKFSSPNVESAIMRAKSEEIDAAEIPLEERFYFEPLDDGMKK